MSYPNEIATAALSKMLRRPVKFVADRLESFISDIPARDHCVKGRTAVRHDGTITAFQIDDLTGIGPYSMYPRTSAIEANQVVNFVGAPCATPNYRAQTRVVLRCWRSSHLVPGWRSGASRRIRILCQTSVTEPGQGAEAVTAQVVATALG
jgi:CO/xanthine dehydrogenase Mo-binding subunit